MLEFAPDWVQQIDTTPREPYGPHDRSNLIGSVHVAIRFVPYVGYTALCALVIRGLTSRIEVGRDVTHGNSVRPYVHHGDSDRNHSLLLTRVGRLDLFPPYEFTFGSFHDTLMLIRDHFGGEALDPTVKSGSTATATSASAVVATIHTIHSVKPNVKLYSLDAIELSDEQRQDERRDSQLHDCEHYKIGMHIVVDIRYSKTLVRVSACPEIVRRFEAHNGDYQRDEFHLLGSDATTIDLYNHIRNYYSTLVDFSTYTMTLRVFTGNTLCDCENNRDCVCEMHTLPWTPRAIQSLSYYYHGMHCHMNLFDTNGDMMPITTPCTDDTQPTIVAVNTVPVGTSDNTDITYLLSTQTPTHPNPATPQQPPHAPPIHAQQPPAQPNLTVTRLRGSGPRSKSRSSGKEQQTPTSNAFDALSHTESEEAEDHPAQSNTALTPATATPQQPPENPNPTQAQGLHDEASAHDGETTDSMEPHVITTEHKPTDTTVKVDTAAYAPFDESNALRSDYWDLRDHVHAETSKTNTEIKEIQAELRATATSIHDVNRTISRISDELGHNSKTQQSTSTSLQNLIQNNGLRTEQLHMQFTAMESTLTLIVQRLESTNPAPVQDDRPSARPRDDQPGLTRFTLPPSGRGFGRGRSTAGPSRQHMSDNTTHRHANRTQTHTRPTTSDRHHPPPYRDRVAYCRSVTDVHDDDDDLTFALLPVAHTDDSTSAGVSEEFRTWTLVNPKSTTVSIETAIFSLFRITQRAVEDVSASTGLEFHVCRFKRRLQYGDDTDDTLDGIIRVTFPNEENIDVLQLIKSYINDITTNHNIDDTTEHRINATIPSHTAVKAASSAHLAAIGSQSRIIERNDLRKAVLEALMIYPYYEESLTHHNDHNTDFTTSYPTSSSKPYRTLWARLAQMDVASALPAWQPGTSIQAYQQSILTCLHTDTATLLPDVLREHEPLNTIIAAILRRHNEFDEFNTRVSADSAENLNRELIAFKEIYATKILNAQANPTDPKHQRSFLSVLSVCLAATRSAFLGTSRDGALHSEARQFINHLMTMQAGSDNEYLIAANVHWIRYSKLWGPILMLNLCDGGQLQTILPTVTVRLSPSMQERILQFFGGIAHRLRTAHQNGKLPDDLSRQLATFLDRPLRLHSSIPRMSTYAEISGQEEAIADHHITETTHGHDTQRIAHPADLSFVGKCGAILDWWPAMILYAVGHHQRAAATLPTQLAVTSTWDDTYTNQDDDVLAVTSADNTRFKPGPKTIELQHDRLATAADKQFNKLEANVTKAQSQIESKVGSLQSGLEAVLDTKVNALQTNIEKQLGSILGSISKVSKDLGTRLDHNDAAMAAFREMNAHNALTMQHCLRNVAESTTDLRHATTIRDTASALGKHVQAQQAPTPTLPPIRQAASTSLMYAAQDDTGDAIAHLFYIAGNDVTTLDELVAWVNNEEDTDASELLALTFTRRSGATSTPGTLKLTKWPAIKFEELTEQAKELYRRRDNVQTPEHWSTLSSRVCTNCPPDSRLMPHNENRCPTIYRHTAQGQKDRDAVRRARDDERLRELQQEPSKP